MAAAGDQRLAEERLVSLYESRVAAARSAELAAHQAVLDANLQLVAAQQVTTSAQAALDVLRSALQISRGSTHGPTVLPGDILLEIFSHCHDTSDAHPARVAFVLASVSKLWRRTALSSGRMWSCIKIDFTKLDNAYRFLKLMLARSGALPLHIELNDVPTAWIFDDPHLDEGLILQMCRRSRFMRIQFGKEPATSLYEVARFETTFLPYLQTPMPHLEELVLSNVPWAIPHGQHILTLAPRTRTIDFNRLNPDMLSPTSLPNLTTLVSREWEFQPEGLLAIARGWPNLKHLAAITHDALPGVAPLEITFAHLEELDLVRGCGTLAALTAARAPHIRMLLIPKTARAQLELFLGGAPYVALEVLHIFRELSHTFAGAFALLPNLREWKTIEVTDAAALCDALKKWCGLTVAVRQLPKLRRLVFEECNFSVAGAQQLVCFIQRRAEWADTTPGVERIRELTVVQTNSTITHAFPLWLRPRLEELVETVTLDTDTVQPWLDEDEGL